MGKEPIKSHEELEVYKMVFDAAMKIFELSKEFPVEERYSLTTDQIRRYQEATKQHGQAGLDFCMAVLASFLE